ncbi:MAG TPA: zf-HC2 domain-containing protein, partial [Planctomycetota bacterium]|nr:zf-HC2 domain-containing protein [Planctomycetota bacterium]
MTTPPLTPTPAPLGAESPIEVTFPDGSTATFDQLRDMLDEFHDGELDATTREKIRYALEHCPRLAQESSVIIGISRLLKSYEGAPAGSGANLLSDDQLRSKILGKLQNEPPPGKPAGFPWGAVVIGVVVLAVAAVIALYLYNLNSQEAPPIDMAPHAPAAAPKLNRSEMLKTIRIPDVIEASVPSVTLLQGKATLYSAGEMSREFTPGETVTLVDGQQVEVAEGASVLVTGKGKGTLKIDNPKTAASAKNKLTVEYQNGRLP